MTPALRRRTLLAGGLAALGAAACARISPPRTGTSVAAACPGLPFGVPLSDAEGRAFAAFDRSVAPVAWGQGMHGTPKWAVFSIDPFVPPPWSMPLDAALRRANFDPSFLLPGTLDAFRDHGVTFGLPASLRPLGVAYQPALFAAAGVSAPADVWTVDDFEKASAAIAAAVKVGRVPGCYGPLPPLLGSKSFATAGGGRMTTFGQLSKFGWAGFPLGFGGTLVRGGRFDFSDAAALEGFAKLVQIARDYAPSSDRLPQSQAQMANYEQGVAMRLDYFLNAAFLGKGWRWARFPRMPARPIVPAVLRGWALGHAGGSGQPDPQPTPSEAANDAMVQFALWSYQSQKQTPGTLPVPPVVSDPKAQSAYWQAQPAAPGLNDSTDTWVVGDGWPAFTLQLDDPVFQALTAAAAGGDLRALLADAAKQLNAQVDLQAAKVAARAEEEAKLASMEAAFPVAGVGSPTQACGGQTAG